MCEPPWALCEINDSFTLGTVTTVRTDAYFARNRFTKYFISRMESVILQRLRSWTFRQYSRHNQRVDATFCMMHVRFTYSRHYSCKIKIPAIPWNIFENYDCCNKTLLCISCLVFSWRYHH